ncbi:MAG: hypothetical protein QOD55_1377 [Solirubrobacteraceae bacterium]|jgi:hypothetical protein|nr:hypothetical protein [Solirubrobacteraceae bacterium]MEA2289380.1 hypothetical protein [Solirubrobacteraceae bacterium]
MGRAAGGSPAAQAARERRPAPGAPNGGAKDTWVLR